MIDPFGWGELGYLVVGVDVDVPVVVVDEAVVVSAEEDAVVQGGGAAVGRWWMWWPVHHDGGRCTRRGAGRGRGTRSRRR